MNKKIFKFIFILVCVLISIALVGCKKQTIDFRRDSKVSEFMKNINASKNGVVKKTSNMFIYKDTSSSSNSEDMQFGPGDMIFDLPIKF